MSTVDFEKLNNEDKAKITDRVWWEELSHSSDNEIIEDQHWFQIVTRSSRGLLANSVAKCQLDEGHIDKRIEETIATYQRLNLPFHWRCCPSTRPRDLTKRLVAAGMNLGGHS